MEAWINLAHGGALPRQGQRHVAWSVSPWKGGHRIPESPGGATAIFIRAELPSPSGALGLIWASAPRGSRP